MIDVLKVILSIYFHEHYGNHNDTVEWKSFQVKKTIFP